MNGGLCTAAGSWSGRVVLCERGSISFLEKVQNVQAGGGTAALIYNNVPGAFSGTLGDGSSSPLIALGLSQADGQALVASQLGASAAVSSSLTVPASGYDTYDGTSMATPHVSAVAALVWSSNPALSNVELRDILNTTAMDLGAAGRDINYGYGLVQAAAAVAAAGGGTGGCTSNADCSDGDACNGTEQCVSGACQSGTPVSCPVGTSCDPANGQCVAQCLPSGDTCQNNGQCCSNRCRRVSGVRQCT